MQGVFQPSVVWRRENKESKNDIIMEIIQKTTPKNVVCNSLERFYWMSSTVVTEKI